MHQYTNCYIAFLDILGFKNLINTKSCEEIYRIFSDNMRNPISGFYLGTKPVVSMSDIRVKVMSDSICFYVDSQIKNALVGLLATCQYFQSKLLELPEPILSRGAIVRGDIYATGDIVFGPGFVNAYLLEENYAKYPRIIVEECTIESAKEMTDPALSDYFAQCTFYDFDNYLVIDTLEMFEGFDTDGQKCTALLSYIENALSKMASDDPIQDKYMYLKHQLLRWYKPE